MNTMRSITLAHVKSGGPHETPPQNAWNIKTMKKAPVDSFLCH